MSDKISKINVPITTSTNGTTTTTATDFEIHDPSALTSISYDTTNAKFTKSINGGAAEDVVSCAQSVIENSALPITSGAVYDTLGDIDEALAAILDATGSANTLTVYATTGSSISIVKGQTTITGTTVKGSFETEIPEAGIWTITSTLNGATSMEAIEIVDDYEITMGPAFSASIVIETEPGATVSATCGYLTISGTADSSGDLILTVYKSGTYSVHASKGTGSSATVSVAATTNSGSYSASLPMASIVLSECDTTGATISLTDGTTTIDGGTYSGSAMTFLLPNLGNWTITATYEQDSKSKQLVVENYTQYTISINIYVSIYGVSWDKTSRTQLSRTDAAANFSDPVPYMADGSHPGSSPFDSLMPWSGMVQETIDGNVLVKIPKFWYKITNSSNEMTIQIADGPVDGFLVSPAHQAKNSNESDRDYVYVGRYKCSGASTDTYKSQTRKKPKVSITRATARTAIHNLGSNYWQQDFAMFWTIRLLYIVEFANWNSQSVIGYGCGNNSSTVNTGATDSMPYHTGTMQSSRITYGNGTQYRYIEGLWDNVYEWCDGIYFTGSSKADIYIIKDPANFSDTTGGTKTGTRATTSNCIKNFTIPAATGLEYALYPGANDVVSDSKYSTYVADSCSYYSSGVVLCVGGLHDQNQHYGMFYLYGKSGASDTGSDIGARLQYLP